MTRGNPRYQRRYDLERVSATASIHVNAPTYLDIAQMVWRTLEIR